MLRKGSLTGLLLFGIFFGAGNLIFPPTLGALSGNQFWPAIAGFVLSGVGIAIVTLIIGTLNPKGYIDEISRKIYLGIYSFGIVTSPALKILSRALITPNFPWAKVRPP